MKDDELIAEARLDAKAFRENTVYDSEGDPIRLIANADRLDQYAARIEALTAEVERKDAALRAIDRMNDHPKWFRKELNNILESAALQPQEKVG